MKQANVIIKIQKQDFDVSKETKRLTKNQRDVGAVVTFTGICRGENNKIKAVELEHYPKMAEAQIGRIIQAAQKKWKVDGVSVIHRVGKIQAGKNIVMVVTVSRHRDDAFEAAKFIMDFLKQDAPFWKKEIFGDDNKTQWVKQKKSDANAQKKWQ